MDPDNIDNDSICIYGLSFEYDDIKHIKNYPGKWELNGDGDELKFNEFKLLQFRSSSPWYLCDKDCKIYHVGLVIDFTTPEILLTLKETLVKELKIFCDKNKLSYNEPMIYSHPNIW